MRLHGNARTCLYSRLLIVERVLEQHWTIAAAAQAAGVSERTAAKWLARYRIEWRDGLRDRSSAPRRIPRRTSAERVRAIELLRARLGLRHTRTRPRRPRTNGKAERFIQTVLNEWAYARLYADSEERARALSLWLNHYNYRRPHGSLGHQPPSSRLNNVSRNYT